MTRDLAGREKDLTFLGEAAKHRMADPRILLDRLATVTVVPAIRENARAAIERVLFQHPPLGESSI
jgi:hypothetical protein